ncbi:MAG: hypothetical protein ACI4C1_05130 [Lachnospiraceae bacterium]
MPLPVILGVGAVIVGVTGIGSGVHGTVQMKNASDKMKEAEKRQEKNNERFQKQSEITNQKMDELGNLELQILNEFEEFSDTIEKIQNRPQFAVHQREGFSLPKYDKETLKTVSVGAGVLLAGLSGAAVGAAGGFAAAGATTSAVMAWGTASTGTAIASLSGTAATNATLAALGGGALAAGGGGMALGATILEATTLGVGLLVGGVIVNIIGGKLSDKADKAYDQMKKNEQCINQICNYLMELYDVADEYICSLNMVRKKYLENYSYVWFVVNSLQKVDWEKFSAREKLAVENTVLLVGLLYKMCQVNLVVQAEDGESLNQINELDVGMSLRHAEEILKDIG